MQGIPRIDSNPAKQKVSDFMAATNAYARQLVDRGEADKAEFLSAKNAQEKYKQCIKTVVALANRGHQMHNAAFNALNKEFGGSRESMNIIDELGRRYMQDAGKLAADGVKNGMTPEAAKEFAFNSLAGNPVFDHFGNLNLLAGQLYEEQTFVEAFQGSGDAFAVPQEGGGTNLDKSRFRAPVKQVTGSAKIMQGDINPGSALRDDNNRLQISLYNEFKNAVTLDHVFAITQAMRDQALGYDKAVAPALAGFILQNHYFTDAPKGIMKLAELMFVFGQDANANYTPDVGGSYGILSSAIQLALASASSEVALTATYADWTAAANSGKIIQRINNYYYKPTTVAGPLAQLSIDPALMYKEIVRLLTLPARQNVDFSPTAWRIFVPSDWYALAMQYPGTQTGSTGEGTFNKQLQEMVTTATGGKIINKIEILPSSLLNYGAANGLGGTNSYNYMVAVAMGCPQEKKPVIMPGQTAIPYIVSENVSATIMNFRAQYPFGGPMFMQYGGAFVLQFSNAA